MANLPRNGERVFGYQHRWGIYKPLKRACAAAGVDYLTPHQLGRHTYATWMRRVGVDTRGLVGTIRISMDGRSRWMDNRASRPLRDVIERPWRSLKYECVFLQAFETGNEARTGIGRWIDYNHRRPHSSFDGMTPDEVYVTAPMTEKLAA